MLEGRVAADPVKAAWLSANPLRVLRRARGMSRASLTHKLGCTEMTIVAWEHGLNLPNAEHSTKLEDLFDTMGLARALRLWKGQNPGK